MDKNYRGRAQLLRKRCNRGVVKGKHEGQEGEKVGSAGGRDESMRGESWRGTGKSDIQFRKTLGAVREKRKW